jgi:hypothetical protein
VLNLSACGLTGAIAKFVSKTQLEVLDVSYNSGLTGGLVPDMFTPAGRLRSLVLSGNIGVTGSIPSSLSLLTRLKGACTRSTSTGTIESRVRPPNVGMTLALVVLHPCFLQNFMRATLGCRELCQCCPT